MKPFWNFLPVLLLISHGCDCGEVVEISFSCPPPEQCFVRYNDANTEENMITGERLDSYKQQVCSFGKTVCDEETETITCEGIDYAKTEICDGIDNDCNGEIDDGDHLFVYSYDSQNPCRETEIGVCRYSDAVCVFGEWICIPPEDLFGDEVCDKRDNDCDGEVDEDIEETFVYTGPPETLNVGECRAGIQRCESGVSQVLGMVTPIEEICGNGDDDDCDGMVDEVEIERESYDFALLLDISGSMLGYLQHINTALCNWANTSRFQDSRFAIVAIGISPNQGYLHGIGLISDFTDSVTACSRLTTFLTNPRYTTAIENQLDAILNSMTVGDHIELSWSDSRQKKIVMFSDEPAQWVQEGPDIITLDQKVEEIINACSTTDTTVSVFSEWVASWNYVWNEITSNCGGYLEYLSRDPQQMNDRLNYWFGEQC